MKTFENVVQLGLTKFQIDNLAEELNFSNN